jgi:hypothetical protein
MSNLLRICFHGTPSGAHVELSMLLARDTCPSNAEEHSSLQMQGLVKSYSSEDPSQIQDHLEASLLEAEAFLISGCFAVSKPIWPGASSV